MTGLPLVHIIVLNWNGKEDTLECLRSLRAVTYTARRTLLLDNGSVDGTVETVRKEFPDVEVIENGTNLRFAGGNNVGIRRALDAGTEYVLLLNNDTIVDPGFLDPLIRVATSDQQIGMVGPKIYFYRDPKRLWYAGGSIKWWKGSVAHIGVRELDEGQYDARRDTAFISGCCVLVSRTLIERVGMLDEAYYIYGEDADWSVRASRAGFRLVYEPASVIWHKVSVSAGGHLSWFKNWNKLRSLLRLMIRYAKPYHWLTIPFGIFAASVGGYLRVKKSSPQQIQP